MKKLFSHIVCSLQLLGIIVFSYSSVVKSMKQKKSHQKSNQQMTEKLSITRGDNNPKVKSSFKKVSKALEDDDDSDNHDDHVKKIILKTYKLELIMKSLNDEIPNTKNPSDEDKKSELKNEAQKLKTDILNMLKKKKKKHIINYLSYVKRKKIWTNCF